MRAALVTDQPLLAAGLSAVFERTGALRLVAVYANATELLHVLPAVAPRLIIVDVGPDISFQALSDLLVAAPGCKLVLLARTATAELAYHARDVGASALLLTRLTSDQLLSALERVLAGECVFDAAFSGDGAAARTVHLTKRETQLVELVSQGLKNKEIAACLGISEGTVKVYFSKLFQKVGANDRLELALFGLQNLMSRTDVAPSGGAREKSPVRPRPLARGPKTLYLRHPDPQRVALR